MCRRADWIKLRSSKSNFTVKGEGAQIRTCKVGEERLLCAKYILNVAWRKLFQKDRKCARVHDRAKTKYNIQSFVECAAIYSLLSQIGERAYARSYFALMIQPALSRCISCEKERVLLFLFSSLAAT